MDADCAAVCKAQFGDILFPSVYLVTPQPGPRGSGSLSSYYYSTCEDGVCSCHFKASYSNTGNCAFMGSYRDLYFNEWCVGTWPP